MGVVELKDVGSQNQSIAPAQPLDPSVIIPPPPQFVSDQNRLLSAPCCGTFLSSTASTMSPLAAAARALGHGSSSSTEDPLYSNPSQIVNVSYGTMFNCLPCGKGSVDSQHLSRCANACAHKKDTRTLLGCWQLACRQSREQGTPMPSPFRPPNPVDYVIKVQKAGQGMIPPTLIRAYPGDQAFGAYETLRASVGPSGDFFPQEPPRMDGVSALAPFCIPTGQLVTPYAPGHAHPFPMLQPQYQFPAQAQPPIQTRNQYQLPEYQLPDYTNAAQLALWSVRNSRLCPASDDSRTRFSLSSERHVPAPVPCRSSARLGQHRPFWRIWIQWTSSGIRSGIRPRICSGNRVFRWFPGS
jgi:hypothetical protein